LLLLYGLHSALRWQPTLVIHVIGCIVGRMGTNHIRLPWRSTLAAHRNKCTTIFHHTCFADAASDLLLLLYCSLCQRTVRTTDNVFCR